jgi:hypothetical protein
MADAWLSCARTPRVHFEAFTPFFFDQRASAAGTRSEKRAPGNTARPHPQTPMSHDDKSIRLTARRSECSTRIYAEAGATNCPTAHNESVGAHDSDSLNASLWVVAIARRPPARE